jgi:hypothetical protein
VAKGPTSCGSHPPCRAPTRDLTAPRTHKIIRICKRQGVPILADRAYTGVGPWATTGLRRPAGGELTPTQRTSTEPPPRPEPPSNAAWHN